MKKDQFVNFIDLQKRRRRRTTTHTHTHTTKKQKQKKQEHTHKTPLVQKSANLILVSLQTNPIKIKNSNRLKPTARLLATKSKMRLGCLQFHPAVIRDSKTVSNATLGKLLRDGVEWSGLFRAHRDYLELN